MNDRPAPAHRGILPGQVAEIIVTLDGGAGRRGSGYRVRPGAVRTAAHVIEDAAAVEVRFDADLPGEWTAEMISCWTDLRGDLAVLTIAARAGEPAVVGARFGRIGGDRADKLAAQTLMKAAISCWSKMRVRALRSAGNSLSSWNPLVTALARVDPVAIGALTDELRMRWGSMPTAAFPREPPCVVRRPRQVC